jgi:hypothetical protein
VHTGRYLSSFLGGKEKRIKGGSDRKEGVEESKRREVIEERREKKR